MTQAAGHMDEAKAALARGDLQAAAEAAAHAADAAGPEDPMPLRLLAQILQRQNRLQAALICRRKLCEWTPDDRIAWHERAVLASELGQYDEAIGCWTHIAELHPNEAAPVLGTADLYRRKGDYEAARHALDVAKPLEGNERQAKLIEANLALDLGDRPLALERLYELARDEDAPIFLKIRIGGLLTDAGEHGVAARLLEQIMGAKLDPLESLRAAVAAGTARLGLGDVERGWALFWLKNHIRGQSAAFDVKVRRWWRPGDPLPDGGRILAIPNEGLGDEVMFGALLPALAEHVARVGGQLDVACDPRLESLFKRSLGEGVRVVPFQQRKAEGQAYRDVPTAAEAYDHGLTYLSLPPMLDPEVERTARPAWLKPHQATVDKLRAEISPDGRPVVGLAWTSGMRTGSRAKKYPNLEAVAEAVRDLDAHVVSIQYGRTRADIRALKELGVPVLSIDRLDLKNNLEAQAALGAACDTVVGVANASVALAAATGVSCFMFSTHQGWSALGQSYLPWYRDVRLFSQGDDGDWMPAARAMRAALGEELEALRA